MGEFLGMFQGLANGFDIAFTLTNLTFALIGALALPALSACGKKAPLDPPNKPVKHRQEI